MHLKCLPANLTLDEYHYSEWYKEHSGDKKESVDIPTHATTRR